MSKTITPRIYVACLSSYNNGKLYGDWIDLSFTDKDDVLEQIAEILKASPEDNAEEWAIHDSEGFGGYSVHEHEDLDDLVKLASLIEEHGRAAMALTQEECHIDQIESILNNGVGEYANMEDYAYEFIEDTENLSEFAKQYFDFAAFARDLESNGDIRSIEYNGSCFVFNNC